MRPLSLGISAFFVLSRPTNAILPALAVLAGAYAADVFDARQIIFSSIAVVLLHSVVTIWNDIRDEPSDRLNGITRISTLRSRHGLPALYACVLLALGVTVSLIAWLPVKTDLLLALFMLLAWAYNDKPVQASRRPVASIAILAITYALIPFLIGTGVARLSWQVVLLAVGWTCVRGSLSLLKDYKDAPGDAKAGKKTFLLVFGHSRVARVSFALAAIGYVLCIAMVEVLADNSIQAGETLAVTAGWLLYERRLLFRLQDYAPLNRLFHSLLTYQIIFDGLAIAWLRSS